MASRLMLLGQVLHREVLKPKIVNVRVVQQVYDSHLKMFFPEPQDFKVVEKEAKVSPGDIVKIIKLDKKYSVEVEHELAEVVFPIGRVVDPLSGRRCRGTKFIDEKAREQEAQKVSSAEPWQNYPL